MKRLIFALFAFSLLAVVCCQDESGIEKDKKAIIRVIEGERMAYYSQNLAGLDNSWIQDASSRKLFMTPNGITEFDGWDNIHENHIVETEREMSDFAETAEYSNYNISVYGTTALVVHDSEHRFAIRDEVNSVKMRRIVHLVKVEEDWKIDLLAMYLHPDIPQNEEVQQYEQGNN